MPPKKKPIKLKKKKPKRTKPTKQKQSQKQIVNQIVKVYLDERKKSKRTRRAPQKRNVSSDRQNISISPIFNPINDMYSFRQPQPINPLTEILNRIGSMEQMKKPTNDQIADMYENKIIPGNPLVEPRPIQEKFPSLDPTPTPNPVREIVGDMLNNMFRQVERNDEQQGIEETKENFIEEQENKLVGDILKSDEESRQEGEDIARGIIGDIVDKVDLPDPSSPLSGEEQLSIIKMYNQLRPPGRQGQRPVNMTGYLKAIKRYSKMRKELMEKVSNIQ